MRAEEIWEEFLKTQDIARAGRMILEFVRSLKHEIISYLRGGRRRVEVPRKRRDVRLLSAELIALPNVRRLSRYPTPEELIEALRWARSRRREYLRIAEISGFDLSRHITVVRLVINKLRDEGKVWSSLAEISNMAGGLVITLLALLFMEKEGEVLLVQERPFGEIRVVLNADREILGESEEVV